MWPSGKRSKLWMIESQVQVLLNGRYYPMSESIGLFIAQSPKLLQTDHPDMVQILLKGEKVKSFFHLYNTNTICMNIFYI